MSLYVKANTSLNRSKRSFTFASYSPKSLAILTNLGSSGVPKFKFLTKSSSSTVHPAIFFPLTASEAGVTVYYYISFFYFVKLGGVYRLFLHGLLLFLGCFPRPRFLLFTSLCSRCSRILGLSISIVLQLDSCSFLKLFKSKSPMGNSSGKAS